ncbi:uncharacterized protein EV420DRAFT_1485154 [Desarmillaria tabescens]|uniref:Uncharacterized protein n=1 Tax=Armillaria tabescens TaxID=1929756 RepID=A0AA39MQN5_ARMTA|nr:uncharacterized protein EV420DRAFT_1485154 [Desarmillaria tabescens]KAK0443042.1 hypothetical protein EV420DRAFT_1485154 [Desarmillaria tabescens]
MPSDPNQIQPPLLSFLHQHFSTYLSRSSSRVAVYGFIFLLAYWCRQPMFPSDGPLHHFLVSQHLDEMSCTQGCRNSVLRDLEQPMNCNGAKDQQCNQLISICFGVLCDDRVDRDATQSSDVGGGLVHVMSYSYIGVVASKYVFVGIDTMLLL